MKGRKRKGSRPNDILERAIHMGLVAIVRLASKRISKKTCKFYNSIEDMWNTVLSMGDFSAVQRAEPNMRGMFLKMLWVSTKRFGNREFKRVYSWLEGTVGPLNALLNYAGARLRDLAMTRYPFPEPKTLYIRKYADGSMKVLTKAQNERLKDDGAVKTYKRTGYPKWGKSPLILLAHPTLPEMDFVDMIRAHMVELCRQLFIHNVPRSETHRYIRLLIHRLRPFLDWVYSDGEQGRPDFNRESDRELRQIVLEIRSLYARRTGKRKSVTRTLAEDSDVASLDNFQKKLKRQRNATNDTKEREVYSIILDQIDQDMIVQRDLDKMMEQVLALSSREGNEWHRILLSDLHHPRSLKQVVYAGDTMLNEPSSVLVVGELPVSRRKGQIDLVVFLRREVQGQIIYTPVMILEVKTKTTFDYNLYGIGVRKNKDYVPSLYAWKRTTTEQEWIETFTSPPVPNTIEQLKAYESELLYEYGQVVTFDSAAPKSLWKGVIVLDTDQSPLEVFQAFSSLLDDLVIGMLSDLLDTSQTTAYTLDSKGPRVAAILTPSEGPSELLSEASAPQSLPVEDPFRERVSDDRNLTLYVSVSSPTSSGNSAAWIARNWHLLHHIHDCVKGSSDMRTLWVDLLGDYPGEELIKQRFCLDQLRKEKGITKKQHRTLTGLIENIEFIDMSSQVNGLLSGESPGLEKLIDSISLQFKDSMVHESIVIIDGWSEFRDMVPSNRSHLVRSLETRLLEVLPDSNADVIWIDSGLNHTRMNKHYQRKCISPLPHDSPRRAHLDEIIYNIPTSSRGFGRLLPKRDEERFIVQDVPADVDPWRTSIYVPRLFEFSKRFRSVQGRSPVLDEEEVQNRELRAMHGRGVTLSSIRPHMSTYHKRHASKLEGFALSLVPSILRPRGEQSQGYERKPVEQTFQLLTHPVTGSYSTRLNLNPGVQPPEPNRADGIEYVDADNISRRWYYELAPPHVFDGVEDDEDVVTKPPTVDSSKDSVIDTKRSRELELRRLLKTVRYLLQKPSSKKLHVCLGKIEKVCAQTLLSDYDEIKLLQALERIMDIIIDDANRLQLWETVRSIRLGLMEILNSKNRKVLGEVLKMTPDILLLYGNNLFLTVLTVMERVHKKVLHPHIVPLWQSVVEWELYQLGFKTQQDVVQSKYDLHSIYSNLIKRARTLPTLGLSEHSLSLKQSGQMVWTGKEGNHAVWLIFQSEKGLVGGLVSGLSSKWLRPLYFRCVTDSNIQTHTAESALCSADRNIITVTEVNGHKILWMQSEGEDDPVWLSCVIEHGKGPSLPWIRLRELHEVLALHGEVLAPPVQPVDIAESVDGFLREVASVEKDVAQVICEVGIDAEKEMYEVEFKDRSKQTLLGTLRFRNTSELVRTLRHPVREGTPLRLKKRTLVMWDHQRDIRYMGCDLMREGKREIVSVSFLRPLVHRSRFHPKEYQYPQTCGELLSTIMEKQITLIIQPDNNMFSIELRGVSEGSALKSLEELRLDVFEMALLTECEQLVDTQENSRHDMRIDASQLSDFRFSQIERYPRLKEAVSRVKTDWSIGTWTIDVSEAIDRPNVVLWKIRSLTTKRVWKKRSFQFQLDYHKGLEEHVQVFKRTVNEIIDLKHISGFSETLLKFERLLKEKNLGAGKVRCRLDLDKRSGLDVAVIKMVETGKEINTFPIETYDIEQLEELMVVDGGPLTYYDVENLEEFYKSVRRLKSKERERGRESEDEEDSDLFIVIKEYREEGDKRGLEHSLMMFAREKLDVGETDKSEIAVDEALVHLRELDPNNRLIRSDLARALTVKAEILIAEDREIGVARELLEEARKLAMFLLDTLWAGQTDTIVQETSDRINRLLQHLDGS